MKKISLFIIAIFAISIGVYWSKQSPVKAPTQEAVFVGQPVPGQEGKVVEKVVIKEDERPVINTKIAGLYEVYALEKLVKAESGKVVLFFRADWCPTCRAADADIRANLGKIPENLTILDVNYDNSETLKQKYGVTYQHTFVQVDKDGNMLKKWSGSSTLSALVSQVK